MRSQFWLLVVPGLIVAAALIAVFEIVAPSLSDQPIAIDPRKAVQMTGDPLVALDTRQRGALARWLASHDQYDVIRVYYCNFERDRASCERTISDTPNPYIAVGDFNADGESDFAVMVQVKHAEPLRAYLAVFNGPYSDKDKSMPVLLTEDQDFISMDDQLSASSDGSHTWLMLGPSDSDNGYLLVPKENTYELQYQGHAG